MNKELHKDCHKKLHTALDELLGDFIGHTTRLPNETTIMELVKWSHQQTLSPTEPEDDIRPATRDEIEPVMRNLAESLML